MRRLPDSISKKSYFGFISRRISRDQGRAYMQRQAYEQGPPSPRHHHERTLPDVNDISRRPAFRAQCLGPSVK